MIRAYHLRAPRPIDIRAERTRAGLTQTQAAQLVDHSLRCWCQWESGERPMRWVLYAAFVRLARRNIATLRGNVPKMRKPYRKRVPSPEAPHG